MNRDDLITELREQLAARSDDYFHEVFKMRKRHVIDPSAAWNLSDLREGIRALGSDVSPNRIEIIHAEIWARSLALTVRLHNLMAEILHEGGVPSDDSRVRDFLAALNLISLNYGVLVLIDGSFRLSWLLIHDEGLRMHRVIG